jgi:hypothetical protein
MPNRYIREGINDSERVDALSLEAEVFYRRLQLVVDDYGRFEADEILLLSNAYPRRIKSISLDQIASWLNECTAGEEPLVVVYQVGRKRYLEVTDFRQRIRCSSSKYPSPPLANSARRTNVGQMSDTCPTNAGLARDSPSYSASASYSDSNLFSKEVLNDLREEGAEENHAVPDPPPGDLADNPQTPGDVIEGMLFAAHPEPGKGKAQELEKWQQEKFDGKDGIYTRYWRKGGKKRAWDSFKRLIKTPERYAALEEAFERERPVVGARLEKYRPHFQSWINGEPWLDNGDPPSPGLASERRKTPEEALAELEKFEQEQEEERNANRTRQEPGMERQGGSGRANHAFSPASELQRVNPRPIGSRKGFPIMLHHTRAG